MVYVGQAPKHEWKHLNIDLALKGDPQFLWIRFNLYQNEFLKIAMEQTGIKQGKNGFEKDKARKVLTILRTIRINTKPMLRMPSTHYGSA